MSNRHIFLRCACVLLAGLTAFAAVNATIYYYGGEVVGNHFEGYAETTYPDS